MNFSKERRESVNLFEFENKQNNEGKDKDCMLKLTKEGCLIGDENKISVGNKDSIEETGRSDTTTSEDLIEADGKSKIGKRNPLEGDSNDAKKKNKSQKDKIINKNTLESTNQYVEFLNTPTFRTHSKFKKWILHIIANKPDLFV